MALEGFGAWMATVGLPAGAYIEDGLLVAHLRRHRGQARWLRVEHINMGPNIVDWPIKFDTGGGKRNMSMGSQGAKSETTA
jgi:hypothetical protein